MGAPQGLKPREISASPAENSRELLPGVAPKGSTDPIPIPSLFLGGFVPIPRKEAAQPQKWHFQQPLSWMSLMFLGVSRN